MSAAQQFLRDAITGFSLGGSNFGSTYGGTDGKTDYFKTPKVSLKGLYTGFKPERNIDLGSIGISTDPSINAFNTLPYQSGSDAYPGFQKLPDTPTGEFTWEKLKEFGDWQSQRRREENLFDAYLANQQFQSYLPAMQQMAARTRNLDYGYGMLADIYSPTKQSQRSALEQQKMATAAGAEATMLGAVSDAARAAHLAHIEGLKRRR